MYKEIIINAKTGEETKVEFTDSELKQWQAKQSRFEAEEQKKQEQESSKAEARSAAEAKLIELGLTVEDLKALLG